MVVQYSELAGISSRKSERDVKHLFFKKKFTYLNNSTHLMTDVDGPRCIGDSHHKSPTLSTYNRYLDN